MNACALALVLLVDVSGSVSPERYELQHAGVAQALTDPHVQHVLLVAAGRHGDHRHRVERSAARRGAVAHGPDPPMT